MTTVFNVSKPGYDADTTDKRNLVATSLGTEWKLLTRKAGTVTIPSGDISAEDAYPHGLGYRPSFLLYFTMPQNPNFWFISNTYLEDSTWGEYENKTRIDKENIYINMERGSITGTGFDANLDFIYYIIDQPSSDVANGNDIAIGYEKSSHGIVVSKPGFNADTAKIYNQQLNSNTDYLKYHSVHSGKFTFNNSAGGDDSQSIYHGLGYTPMFMAYGKFDVDSFYGNLPMGRSPQPFISSAYADTNKVGVVIRWAGIPMGGTDHDFYYKLVIFKNKLTI